MIVVLADEAYRPRGAVAMNVRASVLIPAHNKPTTLPLTVDTVLRQTVADLEVIADRRRGHRRRARRDREARRGATNGSASSTSPRGRTMVSATDTTPSWRPAATRIFYLCDDDLLLPEHVTDLLALLEDHDLVQSLNGWITPEGEVRYYADDLSEPEGVALHPARRHCASTRSASRARLTRGPSTSRWVTAGTRLPTVGRPTTTSSRSSSATPRAGRPPLTA